MNVSKGYPPNIEKIKKTFPIYDGVVFTYGSTLYAPNFDYPIPDDLMVHEEKHSEQQLSDPEGWWDEYIANPQFRLKMELQAYRTQYQFFSKHHNRNANYKFLTFIAKDFASELYGNIIDFDTALLAIAS
jgi:hypothetical protein